MQDPIHLLVLSNPTASHLRLLNQIKDPVEVLAGNDPEFVAKHAPGADVILVGSAEGHLLSAAFPLAKKVRWVHSLAAGVEKIIFPELVESPVPVTNGKGIFSESLA